jgi:hypothetical protein
MERLEATGDNALGPEHVPTLNVVGHGGLSEVTHMNVR